MRYGFEKFEEYIKGKSVALIGAGVSNMAAVDLLLSLGAKVTARDGKEDAEKEALLRAKGVATVFGEKYLNGLCEDVLLKSPGIRPDVPEIAAAVAGGSVLTSEMEIFLAFCPCKVYAITGSDGKTTTTTLVSEILKKDRELAGKSGKVYLGGNIGTPLLPFIREMTADDAAVVELSSFQLFAMEAETDVAIVTNVTPNHLNWHIDMQEYIDSKAKIFAHGCKRLVLNAENEITRGFAYGREELTTMFSSKKSGGYAREIFLDGEGIFYRDGAKFVPVLCRDDIKLPGMHNVENYMAAIAALWGEVSLEAILSVARNFGGVAHRIELVRECGGVKYYNSSIDTSPTRTEAALRSFKEKLIVIVGGYDKHIPLEPLAPLLAEKAKFVSATGATGEKIMKLLLDSGYPCDKIVYTKEFDGAFRAAVNAAEKGDTVILSPACASFDAFKNFETRGNYFKELVNAL
jgi:UDP-N-acetylmuramoylalanine--D-glutamate ligase